MSNLPINFTDPKLNPIKVNLNFSEKHPKAARVVQLTAVVLGVLALLLGIALIIGIPFGAPISMILGGCLFAAGGALFASGTIAMILQNRHRHATNQINQKKLSQSLLRQKDLESLDSEDLKKSWATHNSIVQQFKKLNLGVSPTERKVLDQVMLSDGSSLGEYADLISKDYEACVKLLEYRQELLKEETAYEETRPLQSLTHRNKVVMSTLSRITDKLTKAGGVFSLKFSMLSSRMSAIHITVSVILALGAVASVMAVAALVPGGIFALPLLLAVGINAGVIVVGLSYVLRQILSKTKRNRQDFYKDFVKTVDLDLISEMTSLQRFLFETLKGVLKEEEEISLGGQDWYTRYLANIPVETKLQEELRNTLQEIDNQTKKMEKDIEILEKEVNSGRLYVPTKESKDSDKDSIFTKGKMFAELRRASPKDIHKIYNLGDEDISDPRFPPWIPKKEMEPDSRAEPISTLISDSREESLLKYGIDPVLKALQKKSELLEEQLASIRKWRNPVGEYSGNVIYSDRQLLDIQESEIQFYMHLQQAREKVTSYLERIVELQNRILRMISKGASDATEGLEE
ncbi:IncA family protein [Candidatus Chlamydia corallus]|uniref:IncA family protein n=1 Tax=Candidatus Chlamydia corallus TaxID=2038470 RepID=UPI000C2F8480|nr:IncA family protein [Candidatus Chlamydia corallus]